MDKFLKVMVYMAALFTFSILSLIILYVIFKGLPHISLDLFSLKYTTENVSLTPAIITTLLMIVVSLAITLPIGIFSAIYLVEYGQQDRIIIRLISLATESLSGIPSIVYGLFGMLFFVSYLKLGFSIISGCLTLSIMILPLIIRTTEEALLSVANSLREASFALGAGKSRTILKIVIPAAMPGILSGIILAIGRIVGESAALIYTAGTVAQMPKNLLSSGRTLSVHMYALSGEGIHTEKAYATAVVLMIVILLINYLSTRISNRITGGKDNG